MASSPSNESQDGDKLTAIVLEEGAADDISPADVPSGAVFIADSFASEFTNLRPNVRALSVTLGISIVWTAAQIVGARVAHSSSLMTDALAMCVDGLAYAFNLFSELRPEQERTVKLLAPLFSASLLLIVTAVSLVDAIGTLRGGGVGEGGDEVDGALVLGFGVAMLLADVLMLCSIFYRGSDAAGVTSEKAVDGGLNGMFNGMYGHPPCGVSPHTELNLFSGLSHVTADALRSVAQVAVGLLILGGGPSAAVDAYGTLVISGTILVGAVLLLGEVTAQWRRAPVGQWQPPGNEGDERNEMM